MPLEWFRWLDAGGLVLLAGPALSEGTPRGFATLMGALEKPPVRPAAPFPMGPPVTPSEYAVDRKYGERLAAIQQVREGRHAVSIGWLWLAGTVSTTSDDGATIRRQIFQPLVHRTVRVGHRGTFTWQLTPNGDPEITELIRDRATADRLERAIEYGGGAFASFDDLTPTLLSRLPRLKRFAQDCVDAAGFPPMPFSLDRPQPEVAMRHDGLKLIVGLAVYTTDEPERTTRSGSLLAWPRPTVDEHTAFRAIYGGSEPAGPPAERGLESPVPLTSQQRTVVEMARTAPLTVVSGAPGTGKSHTLISIVCDALQRGDSVLVAAKNDAAVDALLDLLGRQPGLTPVVFGSTDRRAKLAKRLEGGEVRPASTAAIDAAREQLDEATRARDAAMDIARAALRDEWLQTPSGQAALEPARRIAPHVMGGTIVGLDATIREATTSPRNWRGGRRHRAAERHLRRAVGAPADASVDAIVDAVRTLRPTPQSFAPSEACASVADAQQLVHDRLTAWLALEVRSEARLDRAGLAAVATLATALRSGRSALRTQLERLRDHAFTKALPVWVGTLGDVDDLLPAVPAMFDLVLIDEASATEQTVAASALLRARRAVIVGDPRQLRHVSFLSDETIAIAMRRNGVEPSQRSQLDVRRNRLFDAAAAASPVITLDEHFRSAPHLIDVVARSIYDGQLTIATRTPITQSIDCVHVRTTTGTREQGGVVKAEIDAIITALTRMRSISRSVGVITPFRAQADALEAAILHAFHADDLVRMGVRVGTVHAFQGNERDDVLCSLGLIDEDHSGWSFVADSHLLAVMLTRARKSMTVMTGCHPEPTTLLGQYLAAADSPPGEPPPATTLGRWARSVVDELRRAGLDVAEAYPAGRHVVDAALARGQQPVAVICDLHPEGIDAHIQRHLELARAGWVMIDALPCRWEDSLAELTIDILQTARPAPAPSSKVNP